MTSGVDLRLTTLSDRSKMAGTSYMMIRGIVRGIPLEHTRQHLVSNTGETTICCVQVEQEKGCILETIQSLILTIMTMAISAV